MGAYWTVRRRSSNSMNINTTLMILPPRGEEYGFPIACPSNWGRMPRESQDGWLVANGYPKSLINETFSISLVHIETS